MKKARKAHRPSRRSGRSAAEYFLAAIGLLLIALVAGIALSGSCRFRSPSELKPTTGEYGTSQFDVRG